MSNVYSVVGPMIDDIYSGKKISPDKRIEGVSVYSLFAYCGQQHLLNFSHKRDERFREDLITLENRYSAALKRVESELKKNDNRFNLVDIPFDDAKTFQFYTEGRLDYVFRAESGMIRNSIADIRPVNFDELCVAFTRLRYDIADRVAFIKRKLSLPVSGDGPCTVNHRKSKQLRQVMEPTFGIIVWREQVDAIVRASVTVDERSYKEIVTKIVHNHKIIDDHDFMKSLGKEPKNDGIAHEYLKYILDDNFRSVYKYYLQLSEMKQWITTGYMGAYLLAHYNDIAEKYLKNWL